MRLKTFSLIENIIIHHLKPLKYSPLVFFLISVLTIHIGNIIN